MHKGENFFDCDDSFGAYRSGRHRADSPNESLEKPVINEQEITPPAFEATQNPTETIDTAAIPPGDTHQPEPTDPTVPAVASPT
jgi:hypothetical protein